MSSKSLTILIIVIIVALALMIFFAKRQGTTIEAPGSETPVEEAPSSGATPSDEGIPSQAPQEPAEPTSVTPGQKPSSQAPVSPQKSAQIDSALKDISSLDKDLQGINTSDPSFGQVDSELVTP